MEKLIKDRISELNAEKEETLKEYVKASDRERDSLSERNVRISMELNFLKKLQKSASATIIQLNESQQNKFKEWKESFKVNGRLPHIGATGGHFGLEIFFTSIGTVIYGKAWNGQKIDLTEGDF